MKTLGKKITLPVSHFANLVTTFLISEVDTGGVLYEKVFSEISQNSQENTLPERLF